MDVDRLLDFSSQEPPEGADPWLPGFGPGTDLRLVEHRTQWALDYERLEAMLRSALGPLALEIDHVGSTAVPGLPAKPVIDVVVVVADPEAEATYVPALTDRGLVHVVREPWWHGHRLLRHTDPRANVHLFGPDCPEVARMRLFRDWLRAHPGDREVYRRAKEQAAAPGGHVMQYNARKEQVLRDIVRRAVTESVRSGQAGSGWEGSGWDGSGWEGSGAG